MQNAAKFVLQKTKYSDRDIAARIRTEAVEFGWLMSKFGVTPPVALAVTPPELNLDPLSALSTRTVSEPA